MTDYVDAAKTLLRRAQELHGWLVAAHYALMPVVERGAMSESDLVDIGFLNRETAAILDEARKECSARMEIIGRVLAIHIMKRDINSSNPTLKTTGTLATASASPRMIPVMPKKGTPEYCELLMHFGLSKETAESGALVPHWTHMSEVLTERAYTGEPLPAGLLGQKSEPRVTFRKLKQ